MIDGKNFFDLPVKNKEEAYEKIIKISRNNDCATGSFLYFAYFKKKYRLIAIDLSKQNSSIHNKVVLLVNLKTNLVVQQHFIIEKSEETTFEFLQNSVKIL